jgi:hypothetical protein
MSIFLAVNVNDPVDSVDVSASMILIQTLSMIVDTLFIFNPTK